jgi:hypothetical protein
MAIVEDSSSKGAPSTPSPYFGHCYMTADDGSRRPQTPHDDGFAVHIMQILVHSAAAMKSAARVALHAPARPKNAGFAITICQ